MNYGFSDGNLGAKAPWSRNRGALKAPTAAQTATQQAQAKAASAALTAVTPEQKAAAEALAEKARQAWAVQTADTVRRREVLEKAHATWSDPYNSLMREWDIVIGRAQARAQGTIDGLYATLQDEIKSNWFTPTADMLARYNAGAKKANDELQAEVAKIDADYTARAEAVGAQALQEVFDRGVMDAQRGLTKPAEQLDEQRQATYNEGFYEAQKIVQAQAVEKAAADRAAANEAARVAAEKAAEEARQAAERARVQALPQEGSPVSIPVTNLAPAAPIASIVVSDASMPSPTVSNPPAVLKRISLPPLTPSFPSALPAASSPSQAVFQASIGGADLKTVAMIAVPLIVLGLILRR